jgi:hypothetical protein
MACLSIQSPLLRACLIGRYNSKVVN